MKVTHFSIFLTLLFIFQVSCIPQHEKKQKEYNHPQNNNQAHEELPKKIKKPEHPAWSKNINIYEVNIRQYTREGNFEAFAHHLPRLKEMGVKTLYLMPIYPIGKKKRKGTLGNPYSIQNFKAVNPEFGTLNDFKLLVKKIHDMDMYVIIDWVADRTSWDNMLIEIHPDWYQQDRKDNILSPPGTDWTDCAALKYKRNDELWDYMLNAMKFWITETDIDGFRCDAAAMVPEKFWNKARVVLKESKDVLLVAESWEPDLLKNAFDAVYGWEFHYVMNLIAQGKKDVKRLEDYFKKASKIYDEEDYILNYTSSHDENAWNGNTYARLGDAAKTMAVLTFTAPGIPMIYGGQEASLDKDLKFYDKDEIDWNGEDISGFYKKLLNLKTTNKALWNGEFGGETDQVKSSEDLSVYAFIREKNEEKVFVVLNLSDEFQECQLKDGDLKETFTNIFTNEKVTFERKNQFELEPWEYRVYAK